MKQPLIFPAIFQKDDNIYNVYFPDVEGAFTFGESFEEALYMAKDCLELALYEIEKIPAVTVTNSL